MPGGLLNLITHGDENIILNYNPKKTFFKNVYMKYTNFGLQKFRIDYQGQRSLKLNEPSYFSFKIPRHGDLLMDTYLSVTLPNIWSPLYDSSGNENFDPPIKEYQFKWIPHIGCEIIDELEIVSGGQTLQKFSGTYINLLAHRDFSIKKKTFDNMIGHIPELYDPANALNRNGYYPNTIYHTDFGTAGSAPSIRETTLYIPIPAWFTLNSHQAFPLVALQYSELHINIKLKPVKELFTINNIKQQSVNTTASNTDSKIFHRIQPNFNETYHQFYRFLQTPPITQDDYIDKRTDWNSNVHLIANYAFLSENENRILTNKPQTYLIKDVYETKYHDLTNSNIIKTMSSSLTTSWMFVLRRSDAKFRNEWSNYTNWEYSTSPSQQDMTDFSFYDITYDFMTNPKENVTYNKEILLSAGIIVDGKYRENVFPAGIYKHISNFSASYSLTNSLPFVYNYNFCLHTNPETIQPSGAINFSNFKNIELEIVTNSPAINENSSYLVECDETGAIVGIQKPANSIYNYTYDLILFEERYNILTFMNGLCGLKYMR